MGFPYWLIGIAIGGTSWAGYGVGLSAILADNWIYYEKDGVPISEGPWFLKQNYTSANYSTGGSVERTPWLDAFCGMYIAGLTLSWMAAMTVTLMGCFYKCIKPTIQFGWVCAFLGAPFEIIACALYTANIESGYSGSGNPVDTITTEYATGFENGWIAAGLNFLCAIFFTIIWRKSQKPDY